MLGGKRKNFLVIPPPSISFYSLFFFINIFYQPHSKPFHYLLCRLEPSCLPIIHTNKEKVRRKTVGEHRTLHWHTCSNLEKNRGYSNRTLRSAFLWFVQKIYVWPPVVQRFLAWTAFEEIRKSSFFYRTFLRLNVSVVCCQNGSNTN